MNVQQGKSEYRNDVITLPDLLNALWKQKWLVIMTMLAGLAGSLAYLSIAKPVYEAKAYITAPSAADIEPLNIGRFSKQAPLDPISISKVYTTFSKILQSESFKLDFFDIFYKNQMPENSLYSQYSKSINIKDVRIDNSHIYVVAVRAHNKEMADQYLNKFISLANDKAALKLAEDINAQNKSLAKFIQKKIDMAKDVLREVKIDKAKELEKAFAMASADGNHQPPSHNPVTVTDGHAAAVHMLEQQLKILNALQFDVSSVSKLRNLEAEYHMYNNLSVSPKALRLFQMDGKIRLSDTPVSPRQRLVLLFGLVSGLMAGGLIAMVRVSFFRYV